MKKAGPLVLTGIALAAAAAAVASTLLQRPAWLALAHLAPAR